ncbi:MAG: type II secretion system protein, partial [Magnetococcales bacterium]|nr:type II secretion system protein [Magnetococcales bacterium]
MKIRSKSVCFRGSQGWTLLELMIVMAIIGLLASVGLPNMMGYIYQAESNEAVEMSARIAKAIKAFVEGRPNTPEEDFKALIAPGAGKKGNLEPNGTPADQITSLIPTLTIPVDAKFKYEISMDVINQATPRTISLKRVHRLGNVS